MFLNAFCIAHTLNPHAVIEPFVIATNRELSVLHPIHKLLHRHFCDTMNINAFAQHVLINGGGIIEVTVFSAKYSIEISSIVYKDYIFLSKHFLQTSSRGKYLTL